jgi:methylglyoxal reductase
MIMKYRQLGQTDIKVSAIALGTWAIGGGPWWGNSDEKESINTIHAALDAGINLIDTAPAYEFGLSESIIGKAIKGKRDKVILATKCGLWWKDTRGVLFFEISGKSVTRSLRPDTIRLEVEDSLRRLGTDTIDLYQTHWPSIDPDKTPIADTMDCLLKLREEGKIRAIGVSNATIDDMDAYQSVGVISSCQPRFSMLDRGIEADILPYCHKNNISILAYSPLEQGLLTNKIGMDRQLTEDEFRNNIPWFRPENRQKVLDMLAGWQDLCDEHKCTTAQLVIAWTIAQEGLTVALCGARKVKNAVENAKAGDVNLSEATISRMREDVKALGEPIVE